MMSIAVRQVIGSSKGPLTLYSKGADSSIKQRCRDVRYEDDNDFTLADRFASKGLRTLAFACKPIQAESLDSRETSE